jgi:hypothetical protein
LNCANTAAAIARLGAQKHRAGRGIPFASHLPNEPHFFERNSDRAHRLGPHYSHDCMLPCHGLPSLYSVLYSDMQAQSPMAGIIASLSSLRACVLLPLGAMIAGTTRSRIE